MPVSKNTYSGRSILRTLGVGETMATLALMRMQQTPATSDPDASATIVLIKAVQRAMNQLGCAQAITGRLDSSTKACIARVSGPSWENRPWMKITRDLVTMRDAGLKMQSEPTHDAVGAIPSSLGKTGGLILLGGIVYLALKYKK